MNEWCPGIEDGAYPAALVEGWEALAKKDLNEQASGAGGTLKDGVVNMTVFGRSCAVDTRCRSITLDGRAVKQLGAILVLHYLISATGEVPQGTTISYRQLPGGNVFYPSFKERVIDVIAGMFHQNPNLLYSSVKSMGARKREFGDASVTIQVFPHLPVTIIVWKGDSEVHGSANLLFDPTASSYLNTEDLAAVGTFVVTQLIKARTATLTNVNSVNTT
jgi:hypothetical protein